MKAGDYFTVLGWFTKEFLATGIRGQFLYTPYNQSYVGKVFQVLSVEGPFIVTMFEGQKIVIDHRQCDIKILTEEAAQRLAT